ncbi:hypothetical protein AWB77_00613 [Caballeronia fortuita]|uniref:Uncharacterized protein n=1 Tax=Caballeronia fortuita TaxID=1777138 RepID=A0A157ZDQ6_9BURK|nr:hypothetical protein AWB77_00613 [Caballeronia fortuita]
MIVSKNYSKLQEGPRLFCWSSEYAFDFNDRATDQTEPHALLRTCSEYSFTEIR